VLTKRLAFTSRSQHERSTRARDGCHGLCDTLPCHRVIGARGELTGFGGGLNRKRRR